MKFSLHFLRATLFFLVILIDSACNPPLNQYESTITQSPSAKVLDSTPTIAISSTHNLIQTLDLLTLTPKPSRLPSRTLEQTPSVMMTQRPTAPGEAKLSNTAWKRGKSPDNKWFWALEEQPGKQYFLTHFVNADGSLEWFVHPDENIPGWQSTDFIPYFWLPNEPFVFLVGHGCCGDGPSTHYIFRSLARLNLDTGQLSLQFPWRGAYSFDFAPSGKYLVWSSRGSHAVHIIRISTGVENVTILPEKYIDIGSVRGEPPMTWAQDGKKFVQEIYFACESESDIFCTKIAFVVIAAETGSYQIIDNNFTQSFSENDQYEYELIWIDNDNIQFFIANNKTTVRINILESTQ